MSKSQAVVIAYTTDPERVCSSAARISTTSGTAQDIFNEALDSSKNSALVSKVTNMGHNSFTEHASFTIAFTDVSALVEQFLIEFRLASFTVKSRRYVDFGRAGYYVPPGLPDDLESEYVSHMDYLFDSYAFLVDAGVPKEDARFVLPYSFCSNLYCTANARELSYIMRSMFNQGREGFRELEDLAHQLLEQLHGIAPSLFPLSLMVSGRPTNVRVRLEGGLAPVQASCVLVDSTSDPLRKLSIARKVSLGLPYTGGVEDILASEPDSKVALIDGGSRGLEQLAATFLVENISLAGLTHFARHRMQSPVIPELSYTKVNHYVLPESIAADKHLVSVYKGVFQKNFERMASFRMAGFPDERYMCLSGNTLDVLTTMNAREMLVFFKLRCCMRAQWEIREIALKMLSFLRVDAPEIYNLFGSSCFVDGTCPEGAKTCGKPHRC